MSARRPLLTALGATTLLAALWFVPSAGATAPETAQPASAVPVGANTAQDPDGASAVGTVTGSAPSASGARPPSLSLADTGSVDTAPYLLGGTFCLGVGAAFVAFSVRRSPGA
ncbi:MULTISPECIES: hypothetical protein [Streptomyces]|uniref:Uncharacterized protein n=1 Tax=Streptomyces amritsarensis TaxID=681158 RepID=A0ABX3G711_9ACTN|nr:MULTISPECIES: hypothetical protein [Streptomyces]AQT74114.1 hypothetical protein B1K54_22880 [Streptomyces sp. fd1-xmd]MDX6762012.1 hypothetical protein [Streptomyces sp. F8]OLZ69216.1 hypothetical protein AVW11_10545 [Streptomyces amritsarensis]